ncbi:MAG TPA: hypothetical protein VMV47_08175 [Bacteroidales bacterium]|nr:hypothetical protein [Bacteroidales bacterium]HUX95695.1 hypothetical protein [Bacteroidales bacterium]
MMKKILKSISLILLGIMILSQTNLAQRESAHDSINPPVFPIISGLHTLSIHVRDTITHDSVYNFLTGKLMLPIYYAPEKYGHQKYAGVYAGNMVLEPCGPFPDINYANDNFRSIFFGINFEVYKSLAAGEQKLNNRGFTRQVNKGSIYIRDSILCNENVFLALYEVTDKGKRDSLQNTMITNGKNNPGIEYIKEIFIAYNEEVNLQRWKEFLYPLEFANKGICQINDSLTIYFTRGNINEVKGITFKVKSLAKAKQYFKNNNLLVFASGEKINLSSTQTFGLLIYFTDEE